jgi:DNA-binding beta-propeller fold protein YncE
VNLLKRSLFAPFSILCVLFIVLSVPVRAQEDFDMDEVYAEEEFRWGVQAYNGGNFNKAILSFEKALSYTPEDTSIQEWLGKAYFRSGFTETAIEIWEKIVESGGGTPLLRNNIDVIAYRKGLGRELYEGGRFVISAEIEGEQEEYNLFLRPSSILCTSDGSFYVAAYGSNEVVLFNANGALKRRLRGGVYGFDHPFDVAEAADGNLFVTEFEGDRIAKCSRDGYIIETFGGTGRGDGELVGPQFITTDGKGYIYVTDYGNRRVCKFDEEGNFILSFGGPTGRFRGFRSPSGIVYRDGLVYVSDTFGKYVAVFDESGNFVESLGKGGLEAPEGLSLFRDGRLLVSDTGRIVSLDTETEEVMMLSDLEGQGEKILKAELDDNGNIVAADFGRSNVAILSEISSIYSGLYVQVDRIHAVDHPEVLVAATVTTRLGEPVTGLENSNFILTEDRKPVIEPILDHTVNEAEFADITLLIDKSPEMTAYSEQLREAISMFADAVGGRAEVRVVSASAAPVVAAEAGSSEREVIEGAFKQEFSSEWRFDTGLRLSVSELLDGTARKAVVFITHGKIDERAFSQYGLIESKQYLENNHVRFYCLNLSPEPADEEFAFLCGETGGKEVYLYHPKGITPLEEHIFSYRSGTYYFTYRSPTYSDYGRKYIPMEVEVIHFKRSGRDESGYFAPLQY